MTDSGLNHRNHQHHLLLFKTQLEMNDIAEIWAIGQIAQKLGV